MREGDLLSTAQLYSKSSIRSLLSGSTVSPWASNWNQALARLHPAARHGHLRPAAVSNNFRFGTASDHPAVWQCIRDGKNTEFEIDIDVHDVLIAKLPETLLELLLTLKVFAEFCCKVHTNDADASSPQELLRAPTDNCSSYFGQRRLRHKHLTLQSTRRIL